MRLERILCLEHRLMTFNMITTMKRSFAKLIACLGLLLLLDTPEGHAQMQIDKPRVAILVYEGVQVIDHTIPFEVFGQFSLNEVYTVARDSAPLTTYMGMRILPNYSFADAPPPDVLVLPGGDAGEAQNDPEIMRWVERTAAEAAHVLTVCTGIFFLEGNSLLDQGAITTWYDRQDELQQVAPGAHVRGDIIVAENGKLVSAAGLGVEGALRVLARLHGQAWAEVVRLNMEYEPIPDSLRTARVELADLLLPSGIYSVFPWRIATMSKYEGNQDFWHMEWEFKSFATPDSMRENFLKVLMAEEGWSLHKEEMGDALWSSYWKIQDIQATPGSALVTLRTEGSEVVLSLRVHTGSQMLKGNPDKY